MATLFTKLFQFLVDLLQYIVVIALNLLIDLINAVILLISGVLGVAIAILPNPTFDFSPPQGLIDIAGNINWFFPLYTMFTCFGIIAVAYVGYFAIRPVLKFFQMT